MKLGYSPPILSVVTLLASALLAFAGTGGQEAGPPRSAAESAGGCGSSVFLVMEQGKLAAVDWVQYARDQVHTRLVETQSHIIEATINLRPDATSSHSLALISTAGQQDEPMKSERDLGEGAIYWSPRVPSSIEQAIQRARVLNVPAAKIPGASLFSGARPEISVQAVDPTSWIVAYLDKKYIALTDGRGCLLSATMPDYGVTIERRNDFPASQYPLWPPYAAPPDAAYRAEEVSIRAPQGHSLAGTLTVPPHKGPDPAAVLITGLSPHETTFLKADPMEYDHQVRCPALVLQGGADATVPVRSAEAIAYAMRAGGNSDVTVRIFPGVSHSLLPDPQGLPSGWGGLPAFFTAPDLLQELTRWSVAKLRPGH